MSDVWTTQSIELPRDTELLTQFYNGLMRSNFPVPGELEPLDVWINKLTTQSTSTTHSLCTLHIDLAIDTSRSHQNQLIGGVVWEYYKYSNCVLITYLVIDESTRGQGTGLYLCLNAWSTMQSCSQLISQHDMPYIILCEVNDPMKIDINQDTIAPIERIRAFQQMGVRQISDIYYVQPELNSTQPRAYDLLLGVVIAPMTLRDDHGRAYVESKVLQQFITDLYTDLGVTNLQSDPDYIKCIQSMSTREKLYFNDFDLSRFKKVNKIHKSNPSVQKSIAQHKITNRMTVVVIGAGLSGLSCARELHIAGYNVCVIEARHRIGGRVYTNRSWDTRIDFGAAWLHGLDGNPLAEYALNNIKNLTTHKTDEQNTIMYHSNGTQLSQQCIFQTYMKFMATQEQLNEYMHQKYNSNTICHQSLYDALHEYYRNNYSTMKFDSIDDKLAFNYLLSFNESLQNASLHDLNGRDYALGTEYDGGDHIPSAGFHAIAISLANGLNIQTGVEVQHIKYTHDNDGIPHVTIECGNDKPVIECNIVVNTVPIGVLQSNAISYTPQLPSQRIQSINRMGAGLYNKVILRFDRVFWSTADYIGYMYDIESNTHQHELHDLTKLHIPHKNVWFVNYYNITNQPILVAMLSAEFAHECEKLSDIDTVQLVINRLQHMYPNQVSKCVDSQVTRWGSDPYSRCSYSYLPTGASIDDIIELQKPVDNTIFWAGEHTSTARFGYTDGAYDSGLREAKRIMELYRKYDMTNIDSKL